MGKTFTKTVEMLQKAYGDQVLSQTTVYEWFKRFKEDRGSPRKVRLQKSKVATKHITFFDSEGMIHKEFVPEGSTVNGQYYLGMIQRLLARIRRFRAQYKPQGSCLLLHNNAPAYNFRSGC